MTKKIMGIIVILTMLLSICPCASFATLTAQELADNINLDMMTSQSSYAITKALDFSSVVSEVESNGATVTFTSSDEAVLFISGNTGKITRDADEDKTVTLTVSVSKDGATASKEIEFIVPAQSVYVFESEGFGRENCVDNGIQSLGTRWEESTLTETATNGILGKIEKGIAGYSFNLTKSEYSAVSTPYAIYSFDDMPKAGVVKFSYSLTLGDYELDVETANYDGIYFDAELYAKDESGNSLAVTSGSKYIGKTRLQVYKDSNAQSANLQFSVRTDDVGTTHMTSKAKAVAFGTKTRITHEIDFENKTYKLYIGDSISVSESFLGNSSTTAEYLDYFKFNIQRQGKSTSMEFDDFVVTSSRSSLVGKDLTVSDAKGSLSLKVTGSNERIAVTSRYDKENTLTQTLGVKSNTNEHIEFYDVYMTDKTGKQTDLLERTIADESSPITIRGIQLGGNHGPAAPRIKVAGHGKTVADVGTLWRDAAGGEWVLVSIYSADYLILFSTDIPASWGAFPSAVATEDSDGNASCVLTRLEDGEETGETMTFTAQTADQLYFLTKDNKQVCTAYLADGTEEIIDLSVNRELSADKVQIVDTYTITNAEAFAEELITNRPEGGYSEENPPVYAGGADIFYYKAIYTVLDDGTVLTEFDHKYNNINAKGVKYYGIQYYMKANLGGGVKRLIPGSSPFTAPSAVFSGRDSISNGEEQVFDFSVPWQLYRFNTGLSYNTFDLPGSPTWLTKGLGFETDNIPSRQIDFMYDENNVSDISFASGFLPLYDAEPEARKQYTDYAFSTRGTAKAYHFLASKNKGSNPGDTIKAIGYRKYEDADRYDGKASVYSIPYGDMVYYYVDLLQDTSVDIYTLGANEENLTVVENFGDAELTVHNGKITVSGEQKDFVVLTVPREGFSISKTLCNVSTGKVSALVNNLSGEGKDVRLICAGYEEGRMTQIEFKNTNVASGNSVVVFDKDFSNAEKFVIFIFDENGALRPLCENIKQAGLGF